MINKTKIVGEQLKELDYKHLEQVVNLINVGYPSRLLSSKIKLLLQLNNNENTYWNNMINNMSELEIIGMLRGEYTPKLKEYLDIKYGEYKKIDKDLLKKELATRYALQSNMYETFDTKIVASSIFNDMSTTVKELPVEWFTVEQQEQQTNKQKQPTVSWSSDKNNTKSTAEEYTEEAIKNNFSMSNKTIKRIETANKLKGKNIKQPQQDTQTDKTDKTEQPLTPLCILNQHTGLWLITNTIFTENISLLERIIALKYILNVRELDTKILGLKGIQLNENYISFSYNDEVIYTFQNFKVIIPEDLDETVRKNAETIRYTKSKNVLRINRKDMWKELFGGLYEPKESIFDFRINNRKRVN